MTIIGALPFLLQNGTTADATEVDADFDAIISDVNANAAHNGVNTDITALQGLTTPIAQAQGGTTAFIKAAGSSTGSANAQVVSAPVPTGFVLGFGYSITFLAGFTNTGGMTLNVNGTGVFLCVKPSPSSLLQLTGGEVQAGNLVTFVFDGAEFVFQGDASQYGGFGPLVSLASATPDLGTVGSHNVLVTGTTTIASFGSSANIVYPIYFVIFNGALTLMQSSALLLQGSANILTASGDTAIALYRGGGNWSLFGYTRANGQPLNFNANFLQGYINSLTLSTAGGSGTMTIAAGEAVDSTNADTLLLVAATSKTTASWAVGSGNGGIDTGSIANNTWYHFYAIKRVDTGVVDVVFSTSAAAPTLPTNYTLYRRIGAGRTDGSAQWTAFTQTGDQFIWAAPVTDVNAIATTAARVNTALTVPTGVVVNAMFRAGINIGGGASGATIFTSLQENDQAPVFGTIADLSNVTGTYASGSFSRLTNTSAQIGVRSANTVATLTVSTYGWVDRRGKT